MLFKVTHINPFGQRRCARVTAQSVADAMDQMEQAFGDARAVACMRMAARPGLRVVRSFTERLLCVA